MSQLCERWCHEPAVLRVVSCAICVEGGVMSQLCEGSSHEPAVWRVAP